jgi:hypothetical protein
MTNKINIDWPNSSLIDISWKKFFFFHSQLADPKYVRAWPGGCGYAKMGSNYAPTMWTQVHSDSQFMKDLI